MPRLPPRWPPTMCSTTPRPGVGCDPARKHAYRLMGPPRTEPRLQVIAPGDPRQGVPLAYLNGRWTASRKVTTSRRSMPR
jgi:hypothetical protein